MIARIVVQVTVLMAAICVALTAGAMALGTRLPTDEIAFDSPGGGSSDIYLLDIQRGITVRLTRDAASEHSPAWSPDGEHLAYVSDRADDRAVYVMRLYGHERHRLTDMDLKGTNPALAWSPDGGTLALSTTEGETQGIFLISADGSNRRRLSEPRGNAFTPTWSQTGQLAFSWSPVANTEIYVMDIAQPEAIHRITEHPLTDITPAWSPDGREIAFTSDRDGSSDIYLMDPDGSSLRPITREPSWELMPAWSPDSQWIAFVSNRAGSNDLYVMRRDGSAARQITFSPGSETRPAWRP